jgi:hypothetical protein
VTFKVRLDPALRNIASDEHDVSFLASSGLQPELETLASDKEISWYSVRQKSNVEIDSRARHPLKDLLASVSANICCRSNTTKEDSSLHVDPARRSESLLDYILLPPNDSGRVQLDSAFVQNNLRATDVLPTAQCHSLGLRHSSSVEVHLIEVHLELTIFFGEVRPSGPLHRRLFAVFELVVDGTKEHDFVGAIAEREDFLRVMGSLGYFFPHALAHFEDL